VELLVQPKSPRILTAQASAGKGSVAFLFPGQGAQRVDMGRGMYDTNSVFRENVDRCCELLAPDLGLDLRSVLYPPATADKNAAADQLMQTSLTQPALFVVEYAMAQTWLSIGLKPKIMTGHSLGEYVAATLAGVFTLEDALHLLAMRGRLMQSLPSGTMLAVVLPEAEVTPLLTDGLSIAAVNGPKICVVSGPDDVVAALAKTLSEKKIATRELKTSHAFHSAMMDPILAAFEDEVRKVPRNRLQIPIVSAMLGRLGTDEEWMSPGYWCAQLRHTVRFADAVGVLLAQPSLVLLEVGPGQTLTTLARQNPAKQPAQTSIYSSPRGANESEVVEFLSAVGQLWTAGVEIDWLALHGGAPRRRVPLPSYPFERKRHWIPQLEVPALTHSSAFPEVEANGITANGAAPSLAEIEAIVDEQLRIMARQIEVLRAAPVSDESNRRTQP
jgi:acyl transferase domain-containing protein